MYLCFFFFLLQLFRRMLQCGLVVKLQQCFVDYETSPSCPSPCGSVGDDEGILIIR